MGGERQTDTHERSNERPLGLAPGLAMKAHSDAVCFRAVVDKAFLEPGVLQGLFGRNTLLGVVYEDLLEEVQECAVERGVDRDELLRIQKSQIGFTC